jgi:hypothetical protein
MFVVELSFALGCPGIYSDCKGVQRLAQKPRPAAGDNPAEKT